MEGKKIERGGDIRTLDDKYVKERIRELLNSEKKIEEVTDLDLDVEGAGNEIILTMRIKAKPKIEGTISITLESNGEKIRVKGEPDIWAGPISKKIIKTFLTPKFQEIHETIVELVEKKEDKKIEEIWIENGRFKVSFKKEEAKEIPVPSTETEKISNENKAITEILAKIHADRGEYEYAIEIYKKLKEQNPEQAKDYDKKISELKNKLGLEEEKSTPEEMEKIIIPEVVDGEKSEIKKEDIESGRDPQMEKAIEMVNNWAKYKNQ